MTALEHLCVHQTFGAFKLLAGDRITVETCFLLDIQAGVSLNFYQGGMGAKLH